MISLYEHQKAGRDFLLEHKKACLFFEVGTGKTFTALSAVTSLPPGRLLIVAPKRVLVNVWMVDKEYDLSTYSVTYLNYEKISRDKFFTSNTYDYIILDEVHKLKGKTTKASRRFSVVCKKAKYVFGLTGTPVANSYVDVYNIYQHCDIQEFGELTYDGFVDRYYVTRRMDTASGYPVKLLIAPKVKYIPELCDRIGKHSMVKRAIDCIDLPEKQTNIVMVDGMVSDEYKKIEEGVFEFCDESRTLILIERLNKLHQAANGFVYDSDKYPVKITANRKLVELAEILGDLLNETEKVIIVYQYKYDLEELKRLSYDWTTDPAEFPKKQILFLQFGQSEGLNLQYCNQMIFYSYDYSFLNYEQMCGRIYRSGQTKNVTYTIMISKGTIEEKIWNCVKSKKTRDEFLKEVLNGR